MWRVLIAIVMVLVACVPGRFVLATEQLADPTAPLTEAARVFSAFAPEQQANLILTSVIIGPKTRIAIINGRRYREANLVADFIIQRIERNTVILVKGRESMELNVSPFNLREF